LRDQPAATGAERGAGSELALAAGQMREREAGDVRAGDELNQRHDDEQNAENRPAPVAHLAGKPGCASLQVHRAPDSSPLDGRILRSQRGALLLIQHVDLRRRGIACDTGL
jgi:hypothetical protein